MMHTTTAGTVAAISSESTSMMLTISFYSFSGYYYDYCRNYFNCTPTIITTATIEMSNHGQGLTNSVLGVSWFSLPAGWSKQWAGVSSGRSEKG